MTTERANISASTQCGDISTFLLARIAEDEAAIRADHEIDEPSLFGFVQMIRDIEAKRRIVEGLVDMDALPDGARNEQRVTLRWVVRSLAAVYSNHPDYDPAWVEASVE